MLLIDRAPPGEAGASFGNAGHIATELLEPLPSPGLLFGFWRELFAFGGVLDIPAAARAGVPPWAARFARAAFRAQSNTRHLAPFVRPAVPALVGMLREIGRPGSACVSMATTSCGSAAMARGARATQARAMDETRGAHAAGARANSLEAVRGGARPRQWPPASGSRNARMWSTRWKWCAPLQPLPRSAAPAFLRRDVRALRAARRMVSGDHRRRYHCREHGDRLRRRVVRAAAAPFGLKVPLEAARGYHVQMPGASHSSTPRSSTPMPTSS